MRTEQRLSRYWCPTFQSTAGKNKASTKIPNNGPPVADITWIEISTIPVRFDIANDRPMIITPQTKPRRSIKVKFRALLFDWVAVIFVSICAGGTKRVSCYFKLVVQSRYSRIRVERKLMRLRSEQVHGLTLKRNCWGNSQYYKS
jgi:hypothetical protein